MVCDPLPLLWIVTLLKMLLDIQFIQLSKAGKFLPQQLRNLLNDAEFSASVLRLRPPHIVAIDFMHDMNICTCSRFARFLMMRTQSGHTHTHTYFSLPKMSEGSCYHLFSSSFMSSRFRSWDPPSLPCSRYLPDGSPRMSRSRLHASTFSRKVCQIRH